MNKPAPFFLARSRAASIIDRVRQVLADTSDVAPGRTTTEEAIRRIRHEIEIQNGIPPLKPCSGEAHGNIHVDHCGECMPRWGFVGPEVKVR